MSMRAGKMQRRSRPSGPDGDRERQRHGTATPPLSARRPQVVALQALQRLADGSQKAASLNGFQANSHNNAGVIQGVRWQDMAKRKFAVPTDLQGSKTGPAGPALQRQKANGWYRMESSGNLRNEDATHSVIRPLPKNTVVKVVDKGAKVSNFKAGLFLTNEHSWTKIPLRNQTGWIEDGKLDDSVKNGRAPHDQFLNAIGAGRTDYHFGLNGAGATNPLGPRMDYVDEIGAGTVAEYDWYTPEPLPAHITPADHNRLGGGLNFGSGIPVAPPNQDPMRIDAVTYKDPTTVAPAVPAAFGSKYEEYTWYRKAKNSHQAHNQIKTAVNYSTQVHPGVDFSKSALIDQLVQHKHIHFHVSGMKAVWRGLGTDEMTGQDFQDVLAKGGTYQAAGGTGYAPGGMKGDVTFRELRFIRRYWNTNLLMPDDGGVERNYRFQGNVTFYFNGQKVKPPWQWNPADTGASPASRA